MTPRQARLVDAAEACQNAARLIEADFPRTDLDEPIGPARRDLVLMKHRDVASLNLASASCMKLAVDPDAYALLMELRDKAPASFTAIMDLVKRELERPAPVEQARAA